MQESPQPLKSSHPTPFTPAQRVLLSPRRVSEDQKLNLMAWAPGLSLKQPLWPRERGEPHTSGLGRGNIFKRKSRCYYHRKRKLILEGKNNKCIGVPIVAQWVKNSISIHEDAGSIPGLPQWIQNSREYRSQTWLGSGIAVAVAVAVVGSCCSDWTPSLGTSICHRCGCKRKKKKRNKRNKITKKRRIHPYPLLISTQPSFHLCSFYNL